MATPLVLRLTSHIEVLNHHAVITWDSWNTACQLHSNWKSKNELMNEWITCEEQHVGSGYCNGPCVPPAWRDYSSCWFLLPYRELWDPRLCARGCLVSPCDLTGMSDDLKEQEWKFGSHTIPNWSMGVSGLRLARSGAVESKDDTNSKGNSPARSAAQARSGIWKTPDFYLPQVSFYFQGICKIIHNNRGFPDLW